MGYETPSALDWILFSGLVVMYFLPWIVAAVKNSRHRSWVVILNVFLAWTVIGWFCALALACQENKR